MDALFGIEGHVTLAQECARAVVIFAYGLAMLRLSGRRTFARWSALDVIVSIIVGSSLARAMTGNAPFGGTLAAVAVLTFLHMAFSIAAARSDRLSRLVEGTAIALGRDGSIDDDARQRNFISSEDLAEALRRRGVEDIAQTNAIHLEANGKISVIKKDA